MCCFGASPRLALRPALRRWSGTRSGPSTRACGRRPSIVTGALEWEEARSQSEGARAALEARTVVLDRVQNDRTAGSAVLSGAVASWLPLVSARIFDACDAVRGEAVRAAGVVLRQGLAHPTTLLAGLVASLADPCDAIRGAALRLVTAEHARRPDLVGMCAAEGLVLGFVRAARLARWTNTADATNTADLTNTADGDAVRRPVRGSGFAGSTASTARGPPTPSAECTPRAWRVRGRGGRRSSARWSPTLTRRARASPERRTCTPCATRRPRPTLNWAAAPTRRSAAPPRAGARASRPRAPRAASTATGARRRRGSRSSTRRSRSS